VSRTKRATISSANAFTSQSRLFSSQRKCLVRLKGSISRTYLRHLPLVSLEFYMILPKKPTTYTTYVPTTIHAYMPRHTSFSGSPDSFRRKAFPVTDSVKKKKKKRRRKKTGRTKNQETFLSEALLGKPICYVGAYVYLGSGNTLSRMNNVFSRS